MAEENICPNCKKSIEIGATFCGNCGYKLVSGPAQPTVTSQVYNNGPASSSQPMSLTLSAAPAGHGNIPAYAIPSSHHKQHWGAIALAFGILGIGAGILIPILGLAFAITAIVLITASFKTIHTWLKVIGSIVSIIALLVSLGVWVYNVEHSLKQHLSATQTGTSSGVATVNVTTPCYSLSFNLEFNVNNTSGSCSMNAYNNSTFQTSSDVFKVVASQTDATAANFDQYAKQAIEQDIAKNLSGFQITNQASNLFDGSPAYYIQAKNVSNNVNFIEEAILHNSSTSNTDNLFVIVHAINGQSASLAALQKSWQWNDR